MYLFIVNPVSGNGRGKKVYEKIKQEPLYKKKECRAFFTEYEGHARSLASHLAEMFKDRVNAILVVGGDGTLHEVVNGLHRYPDVKVAFIPAGSGNDFARGCKLTLKNESLFKQILESPSWKPYWLGKIKNIKSENQALYFSNSIGFGFDGEVASVTNKAGYTKLLSLLKLSRLQYVIALLQVLLSYQPKKLELELDGKKRKIENAFMVTITNHPYFGGGMKIVPDASIHPHHLYVMIIENISKVKVLFLFFTVFFGKHLSFKEVKVYQAETIRVQSNEKIDYQVDGNSGKCTNCTVSKENSTRQIHRFL
ncbi:diacylglycerol kinase family lipid kinase [Virgibacillus sp. MSP4-1]|uniref:diacylglycerol/lipid kinase family protein n=1 Tax=Virgibacillus sp. MSP4-1 TaxID=2700081 RepID=UPI00039A8C5C|nr:diacylglycerol kinase family protein [Virgibacillus sp. MSP4-1]QHS23068.1 diacylglycerol kinase family lipid kinase [Virgibacillus sp. MSP4-1]